MLETYRNAAAKMLLTENPDLDVQDRKVRGLRTRVAQRRDAVAQKLQLERDQSARDQQAARLEQARTDVRALETKREQMVSSLTAALQKLRASDDAARRRGELEVQARQREAERASLETRIQQTEQQLAALRATQPQADQVTPGLPAATRLYPGRVRHAGFAGLGSFAAVWALAALQVLRIPLRRRPAPRAAESAPRAPTGP